MPLVSLYLEFRILQHWYTHALIIKSRQLDTCLIGHMLFAQLLSGCFILDSLWHFKLCGTSHLVHGKIMQCTQIPICEMLILQFQRKLWIMMNGAVVCALELDSTGDLLHELEEFGAITDLR